MPAFAYTERMKRRINPKAKRHAIDVLTAQKQLVRDVAAIKPTPDVLQRVALLVAKARNARHAEFLSKYRHVA